MPTAAELKGSIEQFERQQAQSTVGKFIPCNQNGCANGWIRVFSGKTAGGNPIDPVTGAVKRCQCFYDYAARKKPAATVSRKGPRLLRAGEVEDET